MFEGYDFTDFWDDDDNLITEIEKKLRYKLPESYIWLMKQHNGGMPFKTVFRCPQPNSWNANFIEITGVFGIGRKKPYSLCGDMGSRFWIEE